MPVSRRGVVAALAAAARQSGQQRRGGRGQRGGRGARLGGSAAGDSGGAAGLGALGRGRGQQRRPKTGLLPPRVSTRIDAAPQADPRGSISGQIQLLRRTLGLIGSISGQIQLLRQTLGLIGWISGQIQLLPPARRGLTREVESRALRHLPPCAGEITGARSAVPIPGHRRPGHRRPGRSPGTCPKSYCSITTAGMFACRTASLNAATPSPRISLSLASSASIASTSSSRTA